MSTKSKSRSKKSKNSKRVENTRRVKMSTESNKLASAIKALGPNGHWGTIGDVFNQMEICESVITETRNRHPEHDKAIWNSFSLLMPSKLLQEAPEPVYRAHCTELLDRVYKGQDTTLGTKAEIMMALSESSLAHPLTHTASVLYARLFREILPRTPIAEEIAKLSYMAYDSATESLLADMAQSIRVIDRKPKRQADWYTPPE